MDVVTGSTFLLRSTPSARDEGDASGVWVDYPLFSVMKPGDKASPLLAKLAVLAWP